MLHCAFQLLLIICINICLLSYDTGRVSAFSACDEIDVTFVIDVDSILADSAGVVKFITSIIWSGSSEHTGFSAVIYGANIPRDQRIKIISIHDTQSVTQRQNAEKRVDDKLNAAFNKIKHFHAQSPAASSPHVQRRRMRMGSDSSDAPQPDADSDAGDADADGKVDADVDGPEPDKHSSNDDTDEEGAAGPMPDQNENKPNDDVDDDKSDPKGNDQDLGERGHREGSKSIGLLPAFKVASDQSRPFHAGVRKAKLGYNYLDPTIGNHDDQQVYIIFDHDNSLLQPGDTASICALFDHLDHNQIKNDDEVVLFMLGAKPRKSLIVSLFCNGRIPAYIQKDTFFHFDAAFAFEADKMERIYSKTCPAQIVAPEYHGTINVGNHVQYLDVDTVLYCKLLFIDDDDDPSTPPALDEQHSFIKVKDFTHDDNTFKVDDHLVATPHKTKELKNMGCKTPVLKILRISADDDKEHGLSDSDESNDFKILKLFVGMPASPTNYIQDANVHGIARKHRTRFAGNSRQWSERRYKEEWRQHAGAPRPDPDEWSPGAQEGDLDDIPDENGRPHQNMDTDEEHNELLDKEIEYATLHRDRHGRESSSAHTNDENDEDVLVNQRFSSAFADFDDAMDDFDYIDDIYGAKTAEDDEELWEFDEVDMLKGRMDDHLDDHPLLEHIHDFVLHDRKRRMQNTFRKIVNVRKMALRIRSHRRHQKHFQRQRNPVFGAHTINFGDNLEMQAQSELLEQFLGSWFPFQIRVKGRVILLYLVIPFEWIAIKIPIIDAVLLLPPIKPPGMSLSARGDGMFVLRFGVLFKFVLGCNFEFKWIFFTPLIRVHFSVFIEVGVGTFFYVHCSGMAQMVIDNMLNFGKDLRFAIGVIPVLLRPYVRVFTVLEAIGKPFHGGIKCRYTERLELGFRISTFPSDWRGPIFKRTVKHKGCKPKLGIHVAIRDRESQCPAPEDRITGFNLKINIQIGVILYKIVNIWLRFELVIPFRVTVPQMDPKRCGYPSGVTDVCDIASGGHKTEWLKAEFTLSMHLNVYLGIGLDFTELFSVVKSLVGGKSGGGGNWMGPYSEKKILGPIPLIPVVSLGCIDLRWHLQELDTAWRKSCCGFNGHKQYPPEPQIMGTPKYDDWWMENYADENYGRYYMDNPYYDYDKKDEHLRNPYYDDFYLLRHYGQLAESSEDERETNKGFPNKHLPAP